LQLSNHSKPAANKALHRTAIPLRFIAAGELGRLQYQHKLDYKDSGVLTAKVTISGF
jgi:hypothetical protein